MNFDLLIITDEIASGIYEIRNLFDHIKKTNIGFTYDVIIDRKINADILNASKCILFFRSRSVLDYKIARLCNYLKKPLFLFIDDDFLGLKEDYGVNKVGIWEGRKKALRNMLPYMSAIISPNDLLSEKYAAYAGIERKIRIDTAVDKNSLNTDYKPDSSRIVLYINDGSIDMFNKYLKPALITLGKRRPGFYQVDLLSLKPDCEEIKDVKINFIPHMSYPQFRKYMLETPFFLGLAPLDDNGFNRYKYFNKYIEYTRAGVLGVYSDCPLYRQVVTNHVNGILVDNEANSWVDAIEYCVDNLECHHKYLEEAQKLILAQFNKDNICEHLLRDLPELKGNNISKNATKMDIYKLKTAHLWSRFLERVYLLNRYLKVGGVKTVVKALKQRRMLNKERHNE